MMHNSMMFIIFTEVCSHHYNLHYEVFHHPKKKTMFPSKNFTVLALTFRSGIYFNFLCMEWVVVQLRSFTCGYPVVLTSVLKETILSPH